MSSSMRIMLGLALFTTALVGTRVSGPGSVEWLGVAWQPNAPVGSAPEGPDEFEVIRNRIQARVEIVRQLVEEKMSLFDAAGRFRALNETSAERPLKGWKQFPGCCDNEKMCRQVLAWAETHLRGTVGPDEADEVVCGLEQELGDHIVRHGKVILPGDGE